MKKIISVLVFIASIACIKAQSSNCDCNNTWPPSCYDHCKNYVFKISSQQQLQDVFDVSYQLSVKMKKITTNNNINRIEDFKPHLNKSEYDSVKTKMDFLTKPLNPK